MYTIMKLPNHLSLVKKIYLNKIGINIGEIKLNIKKKNKKRMLIAMIRIK